eukprot:1217905-Prymnesium_polylepis.1
MGGMFLPGYLHDVTGSYCASLLMSLVGIAAPPPAPPPRHPHRRRPLHWKLLQPCRESNRGGLAPLHPCPSPATRTAAVWHFAVV